MGGFFICALAAQQQRAQGREAAEVGTNCAPVTHSQYKYTNRPNQCKTFVQKFSHEHRIVRTFGPFRVPRPGSEYRLMSFDEQDR